MRTTRRTALLGGALAAILGTAVLAAPAAGADEPQVTLDVLKVVDGEYVVETVTVDAPAAATTEQTLEARPEVVAADVAVTYQVTGTPDPYWDVDGPGEAGSVRDVWPRTRGAGQVVAVLDTAASITHEDMAGAVLPGTDVVGGAGDPWHGYGVAGVIAARADNGLGGAGMAPEARVVPVRVCNDGGCPSAAVARGILWAVDHGADVVNMSLSGAGYSDITAAAVLYALDRNVSVVASAGNDGENGNPVMFPAANSGVIAVSATTPTGAPATWAVHGWQADIATVGGSVLIPFPGDGYGSASGTSFSGPAVAGAVALLRAAHPGIRPDQVQAALQAGADSSAWDRAYGAGRLDVPAAFAAADRTDAGLTATGSAQQVAVTWAANGSPFTTVQVDGTARGGSAGTSATVSGLVDGTQVAIDVQPDGGQRSAPVLATAAGAAPVAPVLHSASHGGTSSSATVVLSVSSPGPSAARYSLVRDGLAVGTYGFTLSSTPRSLSFAIGAMPAHETRWSLRAVDTTTGRTSPASNTVVAGTGRPPAPAAGPTGLAATLDGARALLTWDDLGSAYTYRVSVAGSTVAEPRTGGAVLPAPAAGVTRTYDVAVVDAWGQAGPTASVQVTGVAPPAPATVPGAPTGVAAVRGDRQATVSWTAAPDGGSLVTGYRVTASPGGATATTTGGTSATVTGLTNGTAYTFTVTAANAVGTGPASAASAAVTPAGVPTAPTGVTAVRGDGAATVSWTAATANGTPVTGYTVTSTPGGFAASTTGATSVVVPGLTNGVSYAFRVTGTNAVGTGPLSSAATVVPAGLPGAPTGVTAVPGNGSATVSWTAAAANGSAVTGYRVTASPGGATATTTGATSVPVTGLTNGTAYTFTVTATNAVGTGTAGPPSAPVTPAVPVAVPSAPTGVTAVAGNGRATVTWSPAAGNGSPVLDYTLTATPGGATVTTSGTTATVEGLVNGSAYTFRVTARNAGGTGPASAPSAAVTPLAPTAITLAHEAAGGAGGPVGAPVTAEICGLRGGGCYRGFQNGTFYWSPSTGAHLVSGAIAARWGEQRWETGPLGYPTTDPLCGLAGGGCGQQFQGGSIHSSPVGGTRVVWGAIRDRWAATGWEAGSLGYPTSEETCGLRDGGCYQGFERGTVYWSAATGAHDVGGAVALRWGAQRWETGPLGYPTTDTVCGLHGGGCFQHFQRGSIFSSTVGGARVVWGSIRDRWAATGWDFGSLGYPVTEEICGLRDGGCYQGFERGAVYWSPATGAHDVSGVVAQRWAAQRWEAGPLGYPTTDTVCGLHGGGCFQHFQRGSIFSSTVGGARVVWGSIRDRWAATGWDFGSLGYPVTEEICGLRDGGCYQGFERGAVYWSGASGAWPVSAPVAAAWGAQGWETGRVGYPTGMPACTPAGACSQTFQRGTAAWSAGTPVVWR